MQDASATTALTALFGRAAVACKEAIAAYLESERPSLRFQRQVLFAMAALQGSATRGALEDSDVRLVRDVVSDAAATCRTGRTDPDVVRAVSCFDEVLAACAAALGTVEVEPHPIPWRRYLFEDADVEVARAGRLWRVRTAAGEAEDRLLDVALGKLLPLSNRRLGELTVQILHWTAPDTATPA